MSHAGDHRHGVQLEVFTALEGPLHRWHRDSQALDGFDLSKTFWLPVANRELPGTS